MNIFIKKQQFSGFLKRATVLTYSINIDDKR